MFDSLWAYELYHARLPCPSPSPRFTQTHVHWVDDAIQPSHSLLSSSRPAFNPPYHQGLFQRVSLPSGGQSIGGSVSASVLSGLITLLSKGLSRVFSNSQESSPASIIWCSAFFIVQLAHPYKTTGKTIALTRWIFVSKVMSLLFNMLSRFVIAFLPRSKHLSISWLQSPSVVILEPKKIKFVTAAIVSPSICHEVIGPDAMICFLNVEFLANFFTSLFHCHQEAL